MHAVMITYFFVKRTNWRAHVMYMVKVDLSRGKMVEIKRTYHIKFFVIFLSLLSFRGSTYQIVLQDRWDGIKKRFASRPIWCIIHRIVRHEKNLMLAILYFLKNHAMFDLVYLQMVLHHSVMQLLLIHVGRYLLLHTICRLECAWKNITSFLY